MNSGVNPPLAMFAASYSGTQTFFSLDFLIDVHSWRTPPTGQCELLYWLLSRLVVW